MELIASSHSAPATPSRPGEASLSLSNFPPDIKSMIVDQLAEGSQKNPYGRPKGPNCAEEGRILPLQALSTVSREFARLAEPYLWGDVDLKLFDTKHLPYVLASILPRHAHHVTYLDVCAFDFDEYHSYPGGELDQSDAEALVGEPIADIDNDKALFASQLSLLLTRAIGGMTRLSTVRCHVHQLSHVFVKTWGGVEDGPWTGRGMRVWERERSVAAALVDLGPRLVDLELAGSVSSLDDGKGAYEPTEGRLASFLANFQSLSRFAQGDVRIPAVGRSSLLSTLNSFRHLRTLELASIDLLSDAVAAFPWVCPVEVLNLIGDTLPFPSLYNLLSRFSTTLKSLTLHEFALNPRRSGATQRPLSGQCHPFPLPHLHTLRLFPIANRAALLPAFALCPLKWLTFRETCPVSPTEWYDLVSSHADTLKRVTIFHDVEWRIVPLAWRRGSPFRELCRARGIEYDGDTDLSPWYGEALPREDEGVDNASAEGEEESAPVRGEESGMSPGDHSPDV